MFLSSRHLSHLAQQSSRIGRHLIHARAISKPVHTSRRGCPCCAPCRPSQPLRRCPCFLRQGRRHLSDPRGARPSASTSSSPQDPVPPWLSPFLSLGRLGRRTLRAPTTRSSSPTEHARTVLTISSAARLLAQRLLRCEFPHMLHPRLLSCTPLGAG